MYDPNPNRRRRKMKLGTRRLVKRGRGKEEGGGGGRRIDGDEYDTTKATISLLIASIEATTPLTRFELKVQGGSRFGLFDWTGPGNLNVTGSCAGSVFYSGAL